MNNRNRNIFSSNCGIGVSHNIFEKITSLENLFRAWREFKRGKGKKYDVQKFEFNLESNFFNLEQELVQMTYCHGNYTSFYVHDPKLRHIHKACVRDRVVHQAIFRILYPLFDRRFVHDSYSCRFNKGTHRGILRLEQFICKATANYRNRSYVLKCDIDKFFHNIDHNILFHFIRERIADKGTLWLIDEIIKSFEIEKDKGIPLGNVTSQLFANIYLNELDQFIKHILKEKYYIRYCDDFLIINNDREHLANIIPLVSDFLEKNLKLHLNLNKVIIRKVGQGIDFLGYVSLPHYRILRTKTKHRMFAKMKLRKRQLESGLIEEELFDKTLQSYLGILKHCSGYKLRQVLENLTKKQSVI